MRQELFSDIDPPIKQALQRRKNRISDKNDPNRLGEYSKSAWIKVWPLAIIELSKQDFPKLSEDSKPTQTTAGVERYVLGMQPPLEGGGVRDPLSSYNDRIDKDGNTYGYNRPKPGLTGLSVQYEGYSGKGLVKMQLKGVINTLEELDIYKPILFAPGKYWCLEWGFIPHKDDGITHNLITPKTITDLYAVRNMPAIWDKVEEHRKITNGTAEIQIAVVNNYEYTLNAAGGFEFSVDFTGNSTLFRNLQSGAVGSGFIPELQTKLEIRNVDGTIDNVTATADQLRGRRMAGFVEPLEDEPEVEFVEKEKTWQDAAVEGVAGAIGVKLPGSHYGELMIKGAEEKFRAATPNDFFRNLKTYIQECYKIGDISETNSISPWLHAGFHGQRIEGKESRLKTTGIFYEQVPGAVNQAGQKFDYNAFNNEIGPYVTWGWFEDNILNVVYGKNRDKSHPLKWESIDQTGIPIPLNSHKFLYTTTPGKLIIPGRMPDMLENKWDSAEIEDSIRKGKYVENQDRSMMDRTGSPSLESTGDDTFGGKIDPTQNFTTFEEVIPPGSYEEKEIKRLELEMVDRQLKTSFKVDKVFGAYHPIVHDYIRISEAALGFDSPLQAVESDAVGGGLIDLIGLDANELEDLAGYVSSEILYDEREKLLGTDHDLRGSIRRLVLHYSLIQESFIGAATPVEGLRILLNKIENMGYKGFWDFDIFEVDDKIGVYEKNSLTPIADYAIEKVKEQADAGKLDSKQQDETPPPGEVFVFPTWNKDGGFVLNQNLTVKMPSTTMLSMIYGQSIEGRNALQNKTFGDGDQPQLFSYISERPPADGKVTPPQKINVDPGFQGTKIDVTKSIGLSGIKSYGYISLRETWTKLKPEIKTKGAAIEYRFEGAKNISIDGVGDEGSIFSRGISIDAYGVMYDNIKQVMNYRLQKDYMKEGGIYTKITDRTTRVLDMCELSLKIQGLSGLNWGNQFHTDYIEQRFKDETVFFVSKVNHEVSEANWTTEIVGGMRAIFKDDYVKEAVTLSTLENRSINIKLSEADNKLIGKMRKTHHKILINSGRMNRINVSQGEGTREQPE